MTEATIIVVTYNSARWRQRQAEALATQTETRWRLVVIDNASNDTERPCASDFPFEVEVIQNERNVGFARANNLGTINRSSPYFIFLNPDAFPEPHWLAALIATAERHPQAAAIGSTQLRADAPGVFDGVGDVLHASGIAYRAWYGKRRAAAPPPSETFSACGAAMLVRREAFEALGGFDERYFCFFEDVDLGFRLRLAGWRVVQSPHAVVAHVGGGSTGQHSAFAEFYGARNRLWTFFKCMPPWLFWPLLPAHLLSTMLIASAGPFRGRGLYAWRGVLAGFGGLGPILKTRSSVQKMRRVTLVGLLGSFAWSPDVLFTRRAVHRKIRG